MSDRSIAAAESYERTVVTYSMSPSVDVLLEHAALRSGERVIDVACGTGIVARRAAPIVGKKGAVVALDINPAMLAVGQTLAPEGSSISWRAADAHHLPLPDAGFDVALCHHGLTFFASRVAALREMRRVLSPGGRACIAIWNIQDSPVSLLIWSTLSRRLGQPIAVLAPGFAISDASAITALLRDAGFGRSAVVTRRLTIRQPREDGVIARILEGARSVTPWLATTPAEDISALAQSVEDEIAPCLAAYREDNIQIFPMSVHIAIGRT